MSLAYIVRLSDHSQEEVATSVLQYPRVLHSPNYTNCSSGQDRLMPCSRLCPLSILAYIVRLSDHGQEEMVTSVLQYLIVLHLLDLHQLFILVRSAYIIDLYFMLL